MRGTRRLVKVIFLALAMASSACRSNHIDVTVENHTGAPVQLVEVDYPSASFGADSLPAGGSLHYRIQVQGSGPVTVAWSAPGGLKPKVKGPVFADHQQGTLEIVLLDGGKAEFGPFAAAIR